MKFRSWILWIVIMLLLSVSVGVIAEGDPEEPSEDPIHTTITFHAGDGLFTNDTDTNVLEYETPWIRGETVTKYSHTSNLSDAGIKQYDYSDYEDFVDIVTIPGAKSLNVSITYSGESTSWDWACVWEGKKTSYNAAQTDYASSISGKLGGSPRQTQTYVISGDTVTFGFHSDSSYAGDGYGYYAVVTGADEWLTLTNGTYEEPASNDPEQVFKCWSTNANGSGTVLDGGWNRFTSDTDIYAVYQNRLLGSGAFRGVNWSLTYDGILTLGLDGETQRFTYVSNFTNSEWPWTTNSLRDSVVSVRFAGQVYGNGDMRRMFDDCTNLETFDPSGFDTSNVTNISFWFYGNESLRSLDLTSLDFSSVVEADRIFDSSYSATGGLEELNLAGLDFSHCDFADVLDGCKFLKVLNLTNVKIGKGSSIFYDLSSLETLILAGTNPFPYTSSDGTVYYNELPKTVQDTFTSLYYAVEWYREDGAYGPWTSDVFARSYTNDMAGTWLRRYASTDEFCVLSTSDNTAYLVKSVTEEVIADGTYTTIHSVSGGDYTGNVYRLNQSMVCYYYKGGSSMTSAIAVDEVHPTTMSSWFYHDTALQSVDLRKVDTSNVTDMHGLFQGCTNLVSADLSSFDTSSVQTMSSMFADCYSLTSVNIQGFDTHNVTNMSSMFSGCRNLESLDISSLDMSNVQSVYGFFDGCAILSSVVLGEDWSFTNVAGTGYCLLPDIVNDIDNGTSFAAAWVKDDETVGPYSPEELRDNYTSALAGTWVARIRAMSAVAVYSESDQCLYFVVSDTPVSYEMGSVHTIHSISGDDYTGKVYPLLSYGYKSILIYYGNSVSYSSTVTTPWISDPFTFVVVIDEMAPTNLSYWFYQCSSCITMDLKKFDVSQCDSAYDMCYQCYNLKSVDIDGWDTSNITDMSYMFYGCSSLEEIDVSGFDTGKVTRFSGMFQSCSSLKEIDVSNWDTHSLEQAGYMFESCSALEELDFSHWNVENVTEMANLAAYCTSLKTLNISNWHCKKYNHLRIAFTGCSSLETVKIENWKLDNGGYIYGMFNYCDNLVSFDMSGSEFRTQVGGTSSLSSYYFLTSCPKLEYLDMSDCTFYGLGGTLALSGMCSNGCTSLKHVDMSGLHLAGDITMYSMFYGCPIEDLDISDWHDDGITSLDMHEMFCNTALSYFDASTSSIGGITNLQGFLRECPNLEWVDVSGWDVTYLTNMSSFVSYCRKLERINFSGWHPGMLSDISSAFSNCEKLQLLDLSGWNVEGVQYFDYVFSYCLALEDLDLTGWSSPIAKRMQGTFNSCQSLVTLDLEDWYTTDLLTDVGSLFSYCTKLEVLNIPNFETTNVTNMSSIGLTSDYNLHEITIGQKWTFFGTGASSAVFPTPQTTLNGFCYKTTWSRNDEAYGPYTPVELRDNYTRAMAGTWVWDVDDTRYSIQYVPSDDRALGSMAIVTLSVDDDYQLAKSKFYLFGCDFDHWEDPDGTTYDAGDVIPAHTYPGGYPVIMTAMLVPRDLSVAIEDNTFELSLRANETAIFDPFPAGIEYKIYEQTPDGWLLIKESDSEGITKSEQASESMFVNECVEDYASAQIEGKKFVNGQLADPDSYKFELRDENGSIIQRTNVRGDGVILFDPIDYGIDDIGVHNYTVIERPGTESQVSYDYHTEHVQVVVQPTGAKVSHTDDLNDDGTRIDVLDHSRDGEVTTVYSHTDNVDDAGIKQSDYVSNQDYADVVTIPNAASLHVKLKYSNVRGNFWIWRGAHEEVRTRSWSSSTINTGTGSIGGYLKSYNNQSGKDGEYLTDEFDVPGDSLSVLWSSYAYPEDSEYYSDVTDYGYYMEISANSYVRTDVYREDGTRIDEFENNKIYADVITIPGATKLHVKLNVNYPYSSGIFRVWEGAHQEVYTQAWSSSFNTSSYRWGYSASSPYMSRNQEFDVNGDSLTVMFQSESYPVTTTNYDILSYGYYMEVSAAALTAEVIYDDDGVVFRNQIDDGFLMLHKTDADNDSNRNATFAYELAFFDDQGLAWDLSDGLTYHSDFGVLPKKEINVYHIGVDHLGNEIGALASERYVISANDVTLLKARDFANFSYAGNNYTNDNATSFILDLSEDVGDVKLYYQELPHHLTIKHMGQNYGYYLMEEEVVDLYCGDEIIIVPKHYDNCIYASNDYSLTAVTDLRGRKMPDSDVTVTLYYDTIRKVTFGHGLGVEERSYKLSLDTGGRGLKTASYGDVDFVNGIAYLTLPEGQSKVVMEIPSGSTITWEPLTLPTLGYWRYGSSAYSDYKTYSGTFTSNTEIMVYSAPTIYVYFAHRYYDADNNLVGTYHYGKYMYPGEPFGTNGRSIGSTYTYGGVAYSYVGQETPETDLVPLNGTSYNVYCYQTFRPRVYITWKYIVVNADGTETSYYDSTYSRGMNGPLHISVYSPSSSYVVDSWRCVTETSLTFEEVVNGTSRYLEGQIGSEPLTFEIRLKKPNQ